MFGSSGFVFGSAGFVSGPSGFVSGPSGFVFGSSGFVFGSSDLCPGRGEIEDWIEKSFIRLYKPKYKRLEISDPADRIDPGKWIDQGELDMIWI